MSTFIPSSTFNTKIRGKKVELSEQNKNKAHKGSQTKQKVEEYEGSQHQPTLKSKSKSVASNGSFLPVTTLNSKPKLVAQTLSSETLSSEKPLASAPKLNSKPKSEI
ncbi:hypothetical protein RCL_jg4757.t1 [Rhizophagus clarus]|uniref:Uncharacterized protein n=1 Tax=Rhizophagus clarus TaxID=94130 RepID=A0A8H3MEW8_9GLOM|nr:hypothetical protein RCL_jg4757.t1 [Rhizophagus clarus]